MYIKYKGKMFTKAVNAVKAHPKRKWMNVKELAKQVGTSTYTIYAARRWLKAHGNDDHPSFRLNTKEAVPVMTDTQELVTEKGKVYGHPLDNFRDAQWGSAVIDKCKDDEVRFALSMIWLKICRLVETPDHEDTIDDIAGYAQTIHMIHAERKRRE